MSPCQREFRFVVVESRTLPVDSGVTKRAVLREASRRVFRVGCLLIFRQMTGGAGRAQGRVLPARMTGRTLLAGVRSCQREFRLIVIEGRALPIGCRMAHGTILWEACGRVVWICGLLIIRSVTSDACST